MEILYAYRMLGKAVYLVQWGVSCVCAQRRQPWNETQAQINWTYEMWSVFRETREEEERNITFYILNIFRSFLLVENTRMKKGRDACAWWFVMARDCAQFFLVTAEHTYAHTFIYTKYADNELLFFFSFFKVTMPFFMCHNLSASTPSLYWNDIHYCWIDMYDMRACVWRRWSKEIYEYKSKWNAIFVFHRRTEYAF